MIVRKYKNRHSTSFLQLVRSMADERWVYDAVDYQLMDMWYYDDYILLNEDYIVLVAEDAEGTVIGFCVGSIRVENIDIKILFVDKNERRKGFGKLLKEQMAKQAYELGKKSISAHNSYSNPASLQLNNILGWTITPIGDFTLTGNNSAEYDYYKAELVFDNKTIKEWDAMSGMTILDPDGFDRADPFLYKRRFSVQEYVENSNACTIQINDRETNIAFFYNFTHCKKGEA